MYKNSRLKKEPDYNVKRRQGTGTIHLETCKTCGYRIPEDLDVQKGSAIPCSEFHVRCVRCQWPVAQTLISPQGVCVNCMGGVERRAYNRKSGRLLYGAIDGSTDPKDYLMNGRMTVHGDEEELLLKRREKQRIV